MSQKVAWVCLSHLCHQPHTRPPPRGTKRETPVIFSCQKNKEASVCCRFCKFCFLLFLSKKILPSPFGFFQGHAAFFFCFIRTRPSPSPFHSEDLPGLQRLHGSERANGGGRASGRRSRGVVLVLRSDLLLHLHGGGGGRTGSSCSPSSSSGAAAADEHRGGGRVARGRRR